jgi:putative transposase
VSRIARVILEGVPYHITQRGNGRQRVFFEDRDYTLYLDLLRNNCTEQRLSIWGYCLMPNHIHLITMPERAAAMAQAMGRTNADFARYYNMRKRSCGHVWQARYHSTPLDAPHLWRAMAYVERNPVRAHLAACAEDYEWSSARPRLEGRGDMLHLTPWQAKYDGPRWQEALRSSIDEEAFGQRLREASRRGRPLGDEEFVENLEKRCGRRLRARPVGRPKKISKEEGGQLSFGYGV